jgi:hypothetical protein
MLWELSFAHDLLSFSSKKDCVRRVILYARRTSIVCTIYITGCDPFDSNEEVNTPAPV